ncbi:MAG: hypothetical protein K8J08_15795 [Thermoanaerobaculia bacterium]|nr:hypothetical protein [Thermoanaerobaculia bacterium]
MTKHLSTPQLGQLCRVDDSGKTSVFEITSAEFNIYNQDKIQWLTLFVVARPSNEAQSGDLPEPELELNLVLSEEEVADLRPDQVLRVRSYDEEFFNLASMYYWTHAPFEGNLRIESISTEMLVGTVHGESDDEPVMLRAAFILNSARRRSFS